jgi:hypothetical protein
MQLVYACFILLFTKKFYVELLASRLATDPPNIFNFFMSGWNVMDFMIITMAYVFAILLMLYQSDPQAVAFNLSVKHYTDMFPVAECVT